MDIGDFIFIFIVILVIIGRVLSWIFNQFIENEPVNDSEKTPSKQQSIKDYVVEWLRTLEDRVSETAGNQWSNHVPQIVDNEWEKLDTHEYYDEIESPTIAPAKEPDTYIQPESIKIDSPPKKRVHKKINFRHMNLETAMIHYEIFSPPISLRQENQYERQFCQ